MLIQRRRVRVWFGRRPIVDYVAAPDLAAEYAAAMAQRYKGLRVTNEPLPDLPPGQPLLLDRPRT